MHKISIKDVNLRRIKESAHSHYVTDPVNPRMDGDFLLAQSWTLAVVSELKRLGLIDFILIQEENNIDTTEGDW